MQQDTNETIGQVSEQDLQDVTGGCNGCKSLVSLGSNKLSEAFAYADRAIAARNINAIQEQTQKIENIRRLTRQAMESIKTPVKSGSDHCESFETLTKPLFEHIHR